MIVLHTLGVAAIHLGARRVLPSATRAFASLLFLCMERGRDVPRAELQALIFPDQGERPAAHNLRQLLYRLRSLGVPVVAGERSVGLPAGAVTDDFSAVGSGAVGAETVAAVAGGILPGYAPDFSRPFAAWVEAQRVRIAHGMLAVLAARLTELREAGRWRELEPVARGVLGLDPLNEEATLALAECLALSGQKARAVQLLDRYIEDVGPYGKDLRLPAHVLRTRISEHVPSPGYRRLGPGPFVGRDAEMAELWRHYQCAKRGEPRTVVIHGEPGIGKTRLATEFMKAAAIDGATCLRVECAPHDVRRPLGVLLELAPRLLEAPGGLGVSPDGMEHLTSLLGRREPGTVGSAPGEPEFLRGRTWKAIEDLVLAVSSEHTVVIVVDDSHWADAASIEHIQEMTAPPSRVSLLLLLTSRESTTPRFPQPTSAVISRFRIRSLPAESSRNLVRTLQSEMGITERLVSEDAVIARARGNPLFLKSLLLSHADPRSSHELPADLRDTIGRELATIPQATIDVLLAAAVLGTHSTPHRLASALDVPFTTLVDALRILDERGFLEPGPAATAVVHPLVSEELQSRTPLTVVHSLHYRAALHLEGAGREAGDASLLWAAAEHWAKCGEASRAVALIRDFARQALSIGQPRSACDLLERIEPLCPPNQRTQLYCDLASSAHAAEDAALTRTAVRNYRLASGGDDVHDPLEFLDIEAARLTDAPIADQISRLEQCLWSARSTVAHRLHAAHMLMVAFEMTLEPDRARQLYRAAVEADLPVAGSEERARLFRLTYHTFAGDPDAAVRDALRVMRLLPESTPPDARRRLLSNAAAALFRCGACTEAAAACRESYATAKQYGMSSSAMYDAASLAWMHWILGEYEKSAYWDSVADDAFAGVGRHSRSALHLSNKIEFALARGEMAEAESWLTRARDEYPEIVTPRSMAIERAYAIRIGIGRDGGVTQQTLDELRALHGRGKAAGLHDAVAECFWHALVSVGRTPEANAMLDAYVRFDRRDRFPFRWPSPAGY